MSELITMHGHQNIRKQLLVAASSLVLGAYGSISTALAGDADRPTVWIELGGGLSGLGGQSEPVVPPFTLVGVQHGLLPADTLQGLPKYSFDGEGTLTLEPKNRSWAFSVAVRYGRADTTRYRHQENLIAPLFFGPSNPIYAYGPNNRSHLNQTADYTVRSSERHLILDFQAGRDVGLGLGSKDNSTIAFGVRIAHLSERSKLDLRADPNARIESQYNPYFQQSVPTLVYYQFYRAQPDIARRFNGVGPSVTWSNSLPIGGQLNDDSELAFDFGANLAVLFGRQTTSIQHKTVGDLYKRQTLAYPKYTHDHYVDTSTVERSRSVVVPNVGGHMGISFRFPNAKVSLGYRADVFFNAIDGGIDTRKSINRSYHGPYASISVGLGG